MHASFAFVGSSCMKLHKMPQVLQFILSFALESVLFAGFSEAYLVSQSLPTPIDERTIKTVEELITFNGYPVETHTVTSEDGYLTKMQRIPYGKDGPLGGSCRTRKPVILLHGLWADAACWVFNPPDTNLAFILMQNCYDVWLANLRGTPGTEHKTLSTKDKKFWKFSWDEIAKYDMPATVDYILSKTGARKVSIIAHSLGTIITMAFLSSKTEYNDKIAGAVLLAPAVYLQHATTPIKLVADPVVGKMAFKILENLDNGNFDLSGPVVTNFKDIVCHNELVALTLCEKFIFFLFGSDIFQLNQLTQPPYNFDHYDFGADENLITYGQVTPPEYDVTKITAPVALYSAQNDVWSPPEDVRRLAGQLSNLVCNIIIDYQFYSHMDFLWGIDNVKLLYNDVIKTLKGFDYGK